MMRRGYGNVIKQNKSSVVFPLQKKSLAFQWLKNKNCRLKQPNLILNLRLKDSLLDESEQCMWTFNYNKLQTIMNTLKLWSKLSTTIVITMKKYETKYDVDGCNVMWNSN